LKKQREIFTKRNIANAKVTTGQQDLTLLQIEIQRAFTSPLAGEGGFSTRGTSVRKTGEG